MSTKPTISLAELLGDTNVVHGVSMPNSSTKLDKRNYKENSVSPLKSTKSRLGVPKFMYESDSDGDNIESLVAQEKERVSSSDVFSPNKMKYDTVRPTILKRHGLLADSDNEDDDVARTQSIVEEIRSPTDKQIIFQNQKNQKSVTDLYAKPTTSTNNLDEWFEDISGECNIHTQIDIPSSSSRPRSRAVTTGLDSTIEVDRVGDSDFFDISECRPNLTILANQSCEPLILESSEEGAEKGVVNMYLARYLMDHQVAGVRWLWRQYCLGRGCILSDDMGVGKTIQTVAVIAAIFNKTGTAADLSANRAKRRGEENSHRSKPCLIVCPASVVDNWIAELNQWGHFLTEVLSAGSAERAGKGRVEVILASYNRMTADVDNLKSVEWSMVVYDEGHVLNKESTLKYKAAMKLSKARLVLVLSGTPLQNEMKELWCILNIATRGRVPEKSQFVEHFVDPIKRAQQKSAAVSAVALGQAREAELHLLLSKYMLSRSKTEVLSDQLKSKKEITVFCELSSLQRKLYMHLLSLPDFDNVRYASVPCGCGSGAPRSNCCNPCYRIPRLPTGEGNVDPRAVVWRQNHPEDEPCEKCPSCVLFPCMQRLFSVACHPALLQIKANDDSASAKRTTQFVRDALSEELGRELGGEVRPSDFLSACRPEISGKMMTLQVLLETFTCKLEKTLVFSSSTRALDLIECFVRSRGWLFSRLDGASAAKTRQPLIDEFNKNTANLIFLLSTKAGGVGINLKSASKVIQFDVSWNPALDLQAQDRCYRIGQNKDVTVYRLITQGTVEEMVYMRQLYKRAISCSVLHPGVRGEGHRSFEGVQGDSSCKGELFGALNLFQFGEESILKKIRKKYSDKIGNDDEGEELN